MGRGKWPTYWKVVRMSEAGTSFARISCRVKIPLLTLALAYRQYWETNLVLANTGTRLVWKITPHGTVAVI